MRKVILSIVLGCSGFVHAQELVFNTPIQLTSTVNSNDEELAPMLSPDGNTLYFIRAFHEANTGGKFAGTDIWMSKRDDQGQWMPASRMDNTWNNKRSNAVIGMSADQSVVYLLNAYTNKSGISFSKYFSGQWGQPEFISVPGINRDDFVGFFVNPQFDVILVTMKGRDTLGEEDLYISIKDSAGIWTEPRNLGPTINTEGFEISPFLSEDKKRLYFSSNGHGGFGNADIFYCERLFDSWETWSVPKNLGKEINSEGFDGYFNQIADSTVTFASNREGTGKADVFLSSISTSITEKRDSAEVVYLGESEVRKIFGKNFISAIEFEKNSSTVRTEQLVRIADFARTIKLEQNLKIHLVARREANSLTLEVNKLRLFNILESFKKTGIEGSRVTFGSEIIRDASGGEDIVFLKFYR